ncbi:MAG: DUF5668 domain-containing protein [Candidatus Dormibacteraeota bacterium]|nr:DUF5668 domain-containing protein [Candidatus Dormibacteraeota bacterium]
MGRHRGLVLPGLLILFGAVALAANLNLLQWNSLYRLLDLWPVLLILIGVELAIRGLASPRTASAIGVVLVVLTAVGAIAYVALAPAIPTGGQVLDSSEPISGLTEASLELSFGAADVNIHAEPLEGTLFKSHIEYGGAKPDVSFDRSKGTLAISDSRQGFGFFFGPRGRRRIDLALDNGLPWSISISGGASHVTLPLGSLPVKDLSLSGGANNVTLTLGQPAGTVAVDVSGGAESVTIHRPSGVDARVVASGGANSVRLDNQHLSGFGDSSAQTAGYDGATNRYAIDVSGGASNVSVVSP